MVVPLLSPRGTHGAITFALSRPGRRYSESDLDLARMLAARAVLAIDNALLYRKEQRAVQSRDQLLAIVSHELKNPLTVIDLQAQLLQKNEASPRLPLRLETIRSSARHMQRIIGDLLDLDQLESGRLTLSRSLEDVSDLVNEPIRMMQPIAGEKKLVLVSDVPENLGSILADRQRINQVISNILGNAIKFTPENGTIRVSARRAEGGAEITVSDSGPGIAEENLPKVFDRYWQDRKTSHLGSGLGLSVAKGIVELHGGGIRIQGRLGQGTQVGFTLPAAERWFCTADGR